MKPKIKIVVGGKVHYLTHYKALKLISAINEEIKEKYDKPFWGKVEKSDREFPDELFTPKSQMKDEENNN